VRFLFVHQNFPGQYLHLVRDLVAKSDNQVLFITENNPNEIPGVRKIIYRMPRKASPATHHDAREFEQAAIRAEAVARTATGLKRLGFTPDIIIGHHGWGELLNLRDVWPDPPMLGYFEFFYHLHGLDVDFDPEFPTNPALYPSIRAKNIVNLLALSLDNVGQTPTRFQLQTYPQWAQSRILLLPEGVSLGVCRPQPAVRNEVFRLKDLLVRPEERLLTYVARDLEPYRGFHVFMRALPRVLQARSDVHVAMVGGDGVSYGARLAQGTWRERMLEELKGRLDLSRVHFLGKLDYSSYVHLLQRSDTHVYLTYPFVASWSLRESLAMGCAVIGSDTAPVREFINHGKNGLLVPFHDVARLSETILQVLEDKDLNAGLRARARRYAETHLSLDISLAAMKATIARLVETRNAPAQAHGAEQTAAESRALPKQAALGS
jgi:glycosyltransferase involved in cell wall biosynthesis